MDECFVTLTRSFLTAQGWFDSQPAFTKVSKISSGIFCGYAFSYQSFQSFSSLLHLPFAKSDPKFVGAKEEILCKTLLFHPETQGIGRLPEAPPKPRDWVVLKCIWSRAGPKPVQPMWLHWTLHLGERLHQLTSWFAQLLRAPVVVRQESSTHFNKASSQLNIASNASECMLIIEHLVSSHSWNEGRPPQNDFTLSLRVFRASSDFELFKTRY